MATKNETVKSVEIIDDLMQPVPFTEGESFKPDLLTGYDYEVVTRVGKDGKKVEEIQRRSFR